MAAELLKVACILNDENLVKEAARGLGGLLSIFRRTPGAAPRKAWKKWAVGGGLTAAGAAWDYNRWVKDSRNPEKDAPWSPWSLILGRDHPYGKPGADLDIDTKSVLHGNNNYHNPTGRDYLEDFGLEGYRAHSNASSPYSALGPAGDARASRIKTIKETLAEGDAKHSEDPRTKTWWATSQRPMLQEELARLQDMQQRMPVSDGGPSVSTAEHAITRRAQHAQRAIKALEKRVNEDTVAVNPGYNSEPILELLAKLNPFATTEEDLNNRKNLLSDYERRYAQYNRALQILQNRRRASGY